MKIRTHSQFKQRGFTLPEALISMGLYVMVLGGVVSVNIFGLRMVGFVKPKLGASDEARSAVNKLTQEVRSANLIRIGTGDLTSFTEVANNTPQQGSALQIFPTTSTNAFIRYFWDDADQKLKRTTNGSTAVAIVATCVSNRMVFTSEDFAGNIITNNQNNRVIGLTLQFYQIQFPVTPIGAGNYYDFYQLRTKITRRTVF